MPRGRRTADTPGARKASRVQDPGHRHPLGPGDRLALERVLANLLDNALRHTPRGEAVELRAFPQAREAVVEVIDPGPGIAPEHHARLFDRFYRVETGRPRERGGAGLGLAIVKSLVAAHGGTVAVRSEVGRGSTFVVRLPLEDG
ncbi:MAG: ATP-binding protein [Verrucomicrobia bacterium]|nr:ATP-binding protein [Verrucomicrobiota bacterium]